MVLAVSCQKDNVRVPKEAVDLGIVMTREDGTTYKLYWAKSNLCEDGLCANPEDYGDYYAWGETAPYYSSQSPLTWKNGKSAGYNWASYKWCNGSSTTLTKYNTTEFKGAVDNITELQRGEKPGETVDDAARQALGGKWRIPTKAEWMELINNCTWPWVENYKGSGINGRLVTATNGNSIFLPAAGYRYDTNLGDAGSRGFYWSSSLNTDFPLNAWDVGLYSDLNYGDGYGYRSYGRSVRPVYED